MDKAPYDPRIPRLLIRTLCATPIPPHPIPAGPMG